MTDPQEIVHSVFARVRAADPSVAELYAVDARLETVAGPRVGRQEIDAFYREVFRSARPQPHVEAVFTNPPTVVALLRVIGSHGSIRRAVDIFDVADGAIRSMRICQEPST
jgi:hypothetical protein